MDCGFPINLDGDQKDKILETHFNELREMGYDEELINQVKILKLVPCMGANKSNNCKMCRMSFYGK